MVTGQCGRDERRAGRGSGREHAMTRECRRRGGLGRRGDRGASAIEYAVIAMVGVLILWVLIYVAIPDHVMRRLPPELCRIFGGGDCQTQPVQTNEDFLPEECERSASQQTYGAVIKVVIVTIGDEYSFLRQEMADGTVRLTVVPTNVQLGLEVGAGGKLNLGRNLQLGADVSIAGGIEVGVGDTYVFENADEADEFEDEIKEISYRDAARDVVQGGNPILNNPLGDWALDQVDDVTGRPDIKDPEITTTTITQEAGVTGTLGLQLPEQATWNIDLNTGVAVNGDRSAEVAVTQDNTDPDNPTTSYFIGLSGTIGGSAQVVGAGAEGELTWSGGQQLKFDEDGRLIEVTYTTTFEKGGDATARVGGTRGEDTAGGGAGGGESTIETVTMTVPINNEADRTAMTNFLATNPQQMPLNLLRYMAGEDNVIHSDPGPTASALDRIMYEQGTVLKQQAES